MGFNRVRGVAIDHLSRWPRAGRQQGLCFWLGLVALAGSIACSIASSFAQAQTPFRSSPAQQFHDALSMYKHGDAGGALAVTGSILAKYPDFVPALKLQGMLLENAGRQAEADESYRKGLKLAPSDSDLLFKVGVSELVAGDRARAATLFERHLRLEPKDGDAYFYLAQAYHLSGRDDRALTAIQACIRIKPNDASVWQKYGELLLSSGDSETGFEWIQKAQQADPHLDRIDFDLGVASLDRMDLANAAAFAEKSVDAHPNDADALELLASVQVELAGWQDAQETFSRILAMNRDDRDALLGLGRCQLELKQYRSAIDSLERLLGLDPSQVLARYYLSKAYSGVGDAVEAQHQADLHHKMVEQSSFASSALGTEQDKAVWPQAKQFLEQGREEQALALFRNDAKGKAASAGTPYFLVGALDLYLGKPADGVRNLHRALDADPKVRGAHTYLGIYNLQQGKLDQAEKEFTAEIANDPNYQTAVAELGVVRYRQQQWAQAADQLSRSHTRTPALLLMLCDAYFHLGHVKDANLTAELVEVYARNDEETMNSLAGLLKLNGQAELARRLTGHSGR